MIFGCDSTRKGTDQRLRPSLVWPAHPSSPASIFRSWGDCTLAGRVLDVDDEIYDYWFANLRCGEKEEVEYTMKLNAWRMD